MADHVRRRAPWRVAAAAVVLSAIGLWANFAARPFYVLSGKPGASERPEFAILSVSVVLGAIALAALCVGAVVATFFSGVRPAYEGEAETTGSSRRPNPA